MKLDKPVNPNYAATVVEVKSIIPLENCDNVVATPFFGYQAIVGKSTKVGDIGILFSAETQLSDEFCFHNNLYRHADKNADESQRGYIEDNRRVKAVKFRGHPSNCLFMSLDSLRFTGIKPDAFKIGDEFDVLNGKEICKKYQVARKIYNKGATAEQKKFVRVESKHMPEHYDSTNYFRWSDNIDPESDIIVTQKLHGTSIRIGNTIAKRKFSFVERILDKVGVNIQPTNYDYIFGSRKVIKDINNPYQNHYYETDIWTETGQRLVGLLPENYIVYAELIGWTPSGEPIQKGYTYGIPKGECHLYIYRIAVINNQGYVTELSWEHVKEFCKKNGLNAVPELWKGKKKDFDPKDYVDKRLFDEGYKQCLYLGADGIVDEGVCVRVDTLVPQIYKAKSPIFLEHETKILDAGTEDLESSQAI